MRILALAAMAVLSAAAVADQIDDFVLSEMARQRVPGLTLAVVKDGKVIRTGAYGKASLELDVPAKVENVFEIGSITKQFTAALTLLMLEEGKLGLDDPLSKHIEGAPDAWKGITLRHLLQQNSGLKEYVVIPGLLLTDEFDQKTFLEKVKPLALDFEPGTTFAYSNTNYALLGLILEKVSGKTYGELLSERILKPLGMGSTRLLDPDAIVPGRAHGYMNFQGQQYRSRPSMLSMLADGALLSTVEDLAKWDIALHGGKVLKPSSYALLTTPGKLNSGRTRPYGMGAFLTPLGGARYVGHHGASPGYSAGYGHFPDAKLSVIVMTNVYAINGQQMVTSVAELIEPSLKAAELKPSPDPNPGRTGKVRAALAVLAENKPDDAAMEPEFTAPMKTDRARMGAGAFAPLKNMTALEFMKAEPYGQDVLLTYRVVTPQRDFTARVVWSPSDKIADFQLRAAGPIKTPPPAR